MAFAKQAICMHDTLRRPVYVSHKSVHQVPEIAQSLAKGGNAIWTMDCVHQNNAVTLGSEIYGEWLQTSISRPPLKRKMEEGGGGPGVEVGGEGGHYAYVTD